MTAAATARHHKAAGNTHAAVEAMAIAGEAAAHSAMAAGAAAGDGVEGV